MSSHGTLKRQRPTADDALSQGSPTSVAKKRRVSEAGDASPTPARSRNRITDVVAGALKNLGRRFSAGVSLSGKPHESTDGILESDEEAKPGPNGSAPKKAQSRRRVSSTPGAKNSSSVYDVPDSGDELDLPEPASQPKPGRSRGRPSANGQESEKRASGRPAKMAQNDATDAHKTQAETPTKRRPGRPRKIQPDAPSSNGTGNLFSAEDLLDPSRISSKLGSRKRGGVAAKPLGDSTGPKGILTPEKRGGDRRRKNVAFDKPQNGKETEVFFEDIPSRVPSSRRAVKPSRKAAEAMADLRVTKQHKAERQRQTVVVEDQEDGQEELEEDAESDVAGAEEEMPDVMDVDEDEDEGEDEEEEEPEEDDEICTICSKPDSKASNKILFCDSCDKAFHQKCYGVTFIPKGDWFCRECVLPEPAPVQDSVPEDHGLTERATLDDPAPDVPNFGHHLQAAQRVLLDRCTGRRRIKLRGQDDAYDKTSQLIEQTIVAGEGNSMLVIGSRGSGKTTLVESILAEMSISHKGEFHVVRLNGFIHTDDKLAVKAIWQQLGKELEEEEGHVGKANTYADTMAYLLSLLSHPSEYAEGQDGVTSQSVIFVIDEFDLFATHGRQTLLYNLLDYAQAKKAPIAVLGLTTRIDVVESLEKRVKSRFSHRYVYLSQAKSVPAFWDMCKQGLTIADEDMEAEEGIDATVEGHAQFWEWWNQRIDTLYKTPSFRDHLEFHFYSTKSVPAFLTTCILPLSSLSPRSLALGIPSDTLALEPPDSNLHVLESLSDLDLALLICAARLDIVAHTDTVNFAMAYDEYTALMGKLRVQTATSGMLAAGGQGRVWGRGVAAIAWERLIDLGLLLPAGVGARGAGTQAGAEGKMWKVDMVLEEIPGAAELNSVLTRWCKEI